MLERVFRLQEVGTTVGVEVMAGATTFLAMAYIVFVQPAVLSGAVTGAPTGMDPGAVTAATCLTAALASILMGLYARYPVALAPGMGQNFFFVVTLIPAVAATGHQEPWRGALGVVFVSGVLFLLLTFSGVREHLMATLSESLRSAIAAGIGLLIAFIGFQNAGVVLRDAATGVRLNPNFDSPDTLIFFAGLAITSALYSRRVRASLLIGMLASLGLALAGQAVLPAGAAAESMLVNAFESSAKVVAWPPSPAPTFLAMDLRAALSLPLVPLVILVLFMDVFDTMGTLVAVGQRAALLRDGELPRVRRAFQVDATGTVAGAALGTSTVTAYLESAAGVEQGGRSGLTAVVTGLLFLLALPFTPLIATVGGYPPITAPALVLVGAMMLAGAARVAWEDPTEAIPSFLILAGIPFTYSIADGMAMGLIAYPILKIATGRGHETGWVSRLLAGTLVLYLVFVRSGIG